MLFIPGIFHQPCKHILLFQQILNAAVRLIPIIDRISLYLLISVAEMDIKTLALNPQAEMKQYVLDKHYMRKHGPNAYYGQK